MNMLRATESETNMMLKLLNQALTRPEHKYSPEEQVVMRVFYDQLRSEHFPVDDYYLSYEVSDESKLPNNMYGLK